MRLKKGKQSVKVPPIQSRTLHTGAHSSVYSNYPIIYCSIPNSNVNVQLIVAFYYCKCSVNCCILLLQMLNTKFSSSVANLHFVVQVIFQYFSTGTWRIASGRKCGHWPAESQPLMVTPAASLVGTCTQLQGRSCTSEPVERAARSLQVYV